jgi:predicted MFS family arabinose efflux permease
MARTPDPTTRLILVLGLAACASTLAGRALDPLVAEVGNEFGVAAATVALLGTAFALPYALVQPVLGPIGDAIGKRRVIRACLGVLVGTLLASAAAPDLGSLTVLRVLAGAATGGVFPITIAIIGDQVPIEKRQVALSRLLVAGLTGWAGGGVLAALAAPLIGWRGVLVVCAVVALAALLVLRERDQMPQGSRQMPQGSRQMPQGSRLNLTEVLARYRTILGLRAARVLYAAVFIEGALVFGVFPFLAPLFLERGLGGAAEAGMALAGFAAGGFAFGLLAPLLLGRFGQGRVMVQGGALAACGLAGLALLPWVAAAVAACLLLGLGFYMIHSAIQTRVTEVAPQARGSAVALHAFSFFLGQSLGPVGVSLGWALVGPGPTLLVAAAGMVALAFWLAPQDCAKDGGGKAVR